jgi:MFS transporter, ACS family, hexuronate transporter
MPEPSSHSPPDTLRWYICGLLLLATTLNYMDRVALNQTSVEVKKSFQLDAKDWGQIEAAFSIAFALGTITTGYIVDRVGVYWIYPALVVCWSVSGFLTGYSTGFLSLLVFRFLLGIFEAGNWPCGIRTTRQLLPPSERAFGNSLFQSGTAIGAILTPFIVLGCTQLLPADHPEKWRWPFRIIGLIGLGWVAAWFWIVPQKLVDAVRPEDANTKPTSFQTVVSDLRFWLMVAVVIGVNTSWHTYRVAMPFYLKQQRGYTDEQFQFFSIAYYLCADIGTWTVGLAVIAFTKRGWQLHRCRLIGFGACVGLVLTSVVIPFLDSRLLIAAQFLLFAFGALGLFTAYFSLSQELSSQHQGKVTGLLGFLNAIYLAGMYLVQGYWADRLGSYEIPMALSGFPALLAFALVLRYWRQPDAIAKPN